MNFVFFFEWLLKTGFTVLHSLKVVFIITASRADPDEMSHLLVLVFHLGLHNLPKYTFRGFKYTYG